MAYKINTTEVTCDFQVSEKCKKTWICCKKTELDVRKSNNGKMICFNCSKKLKSSGRNNPSCKFKTLNDNYFDAIDDKYKAWILGWIASDGTLNKHGFIQFTIHEQDRDALEKIKNIICKELIIRNRTFKGREHHIVLSICSKQIMNSICKHLKITGGHKGFTVGFPLLTEDLTWHFLRGLFEGDGSLRHLYREHPECSIASMSPYMKEGIRDFCMKYNINTSIDKKGVNFHKHAMTFLNKIYTNDDGCFMNRKKELFLEWNNWKPIIRNRWGCSKTINNIKFSKTLTSAIFPELKNDKYMLNVVEKIKDMGNNMMLCNSGLKVLIPLGYYLEFFPINTDKYIIIKTFSIINKYEKSDLQFLIYSNSSELIFPICVGFLKLYKVHNYVAINVKELT